MLWFFIILSSFKSHLCLRPLDLLMNIIIIDVIIIAIIMIILLTYCELLVCQALHVA